MRTRTRTLRPHLRLLSAFVCAALGLWLAAACASDPKRPVTGAADADKFLYDQGIASLGDKKWLKSREYFREIVDNYPQSTFRADAKLGIGDTYLGENTIEAKVLAINEFREFLSYFPNHPRADYAQYRLGLAHFRQMLNPERDQTETKAAIEEFETFVVQYPGSEFAGEVRKLLREAKDRLAESDYRVGVFYYRVKWYPGAIDRFKGLLGRDPEYTNRDAVYFYLAESLIKVNKSAEALPYFERLLAEFEKSRYLEQAKRRVAELKAGHGN